MIYRDATAILCNHLFALLFAGARCIPGIFPTVEQNLFLEAEKLLSHVRLPCKKNTKELTPSRLPKSCFSNN